MTMFARRARGCHRVALLVAVCIDCQPSSTPPRETTPVASTEARREEAPPEWAGDKPAEGPEEAESPAVVVAPSSAASAVIAAAKRVGSVASGPSQSPSPPASASATSVSKDPPPKPPPTIETCNDHMMNPECFSAFPAKVTCPAAFASVHVGAYCGMEGTTQGKACTYPQGVCTCAHTPYCGGVYPTMLQQSGMQWTCRPPRRADDCPDAASAGRSCSKNGQQCGYGGCGTSTQCICTNGKYQCKTQYWAPPP